jgi:hypothetical protein
LYKFIYLAPIKDIGAFKIGVSLNPYIRLTHLSKYYNISMRDTLILKCHSDKEAFRIESLLHTICCEDKIIFRYDGGTEIFRDTKYEQVLDVLKAISNLNGECLKQLSIPDEASDGVDNVISMMTIRLSSILRQQRVSLGLKQSDLSKLSGLSVKAIRALETSRGSTIDSLFRILISLDIGGHIRISYI